MQFVYPNKPVRVYDVPSIISKLSGWIVQPKYDGRRVLIACENNQITLYGRLYQKFKELRPWLSNLPLPQPFLIDGELLRNGNIYIWDYAILGGEHEYRKPYIERWNKIKDLKPMEVNGNKFAVVDSLPAERYAELLDGSKPDHLAIEGCVLKSPAATDLWGIYSTAEVASMVKYRIR